MGLVGDEIQDKHFTMCNKALGKGGQVQLVGHI